MPRPPSYERTGTTTRGLNKITGKRGKPFEKGNQASKGIGRPKGSRSRQDELTEFLTEQATTAGMMPLEFMLNVMRDEKRGLAIRFEAAKAAAPYVHKRMPVAVETTEVPYKVFDVTELEGLTDEELEALEAIVLKAAAAEEARVRGLPPPNPAMTDRTGSHRVSEFIAPRAPALIEHEPQGTIVQETPLPPWANDPTLVDNRDTDNDDA